MYENIVNIELRHHDYDVYAGRLYQKEVGFVALRDSEKPYIQVSDDISHGAAFEREARRCWPSGMPPQNDLDPHPAPET